MRHLGPQASHGPQRKAMPVASAPLNAQGSSDQPSHFAEKTPARRPGVRLREPQRRSYFGSRRQAITTIHRDQAFIRVQQKA